MKCYEMTTQKYQQICGYWKTRDMPEPSIQTLLAQNSKEAILMAEEIERSELKYDDDGFPKTCVGIKLKDSKTGEIIYNGVVSKYAPITIATRWRS